MLQQLHIENIAVIARADVTFDRGFCVLTGETGAGKSILIDSINAVLGERTSRELIRTGCDRGSVTAVFTGLSQQCVDKLHELLLPVEDQLVITRVLTSAKSAGQINGVPATASMIRQLAPYLVNIHGQHDSQALLNADKHYIYIDALAKNSALLAEYQAAFSEMQAVRRQVKTLSETMEERIRRRELLQFQVQELSAAQIRPGEQAALQRRRTEILSAQQIADGLHAALAALAGADDEHGGALELCGAAAAQLEQIAPVSQAASSLRNMLGDAADRLEEVKDGLQQALDSAGFDPGELKQIEERLDVYYRFSDKYGQTEEQMLQYLENAQRELEQLSVSEEQLQTLGQTLQQRVEQVKKLGAELTRSRRQAADRFCADVERQLQFLDMPGVRLCVEIGQAPYSRLGADRVEFLISTNPGEPPKPLTKIASGGEMSRIMLAIKNVLSADDPVGTLIFDEIDAGISGRAASKVGRKLKETAQHRQVICVTHLAQIAALADLHLLIEKQVEQERAVTKITPLDFDGRKRELARIIGSQVTQASLQAAEELLRTAD